MNYFRFPVAFKFVLFLACTSRSLIASTPDCQEDCSRPCCVSLERLIGGFNPPPLWIGSSAPELALGRVLKGIPIRTFEPGTVYVVEFWATWCGPCIAAFPHLTELQQQHSDSLRVLGVNVMEKGVDKQGRAEPIDERLNRFIENQGDRIGFTVARESENGSMARPWLTAAGRTGLPASFIVDQRGHIAWIGHPKDIDQPLEDVLEDDPERLAYVAADAKSKLIESRATRQFWHGVHDKEADPDWLNRLGRAIAYQIAWGDAFKINSLVWPLVESDTAHYRNDPFALEMMEYAISLEPDIDAWVIYNTYATSLYRNGRIDEAIVAQKKAKRMALESHPDDSRLRADMQARLDRYTRAGEE